MPAESYPRYSRRRRPSMMIGTTSFLPTYPTMPHMRGLRGLVFEGAAILFDYRIGEHFPGNAFNLGLRLFAAQTAIEGKLEILALANIVHAFVAHFLQRALDSLALRIEDTLLERDVDV